MLLNLQGYPIQLPDAPSDRTLIWGHEKPKADQYWIRPYQLSDEQYERLSPSQQAEIRRTETIRRTEGFWFYNNGVPTYLTGDAYFYFTHWQIDGEYPLFLMNQVEDFYFDYFCDHDPYCLGSVRMKPRREGCTQRRLATFVNQSSLEFNAHYGIQSKTAEDAEKVNFDNLVRSFIKIPKFMQPDLQNRDLPPHKELIYGKRKSSKDDSESGIALNTKIDWRSTVENAYDGSKLKKYLGDEIFKWYPVDFNKAWDIVKYSLQNRGVVYGKAYLLSTVGDMDNNGVDVARQFWRGSNYSSRTNKRTDTGLYRWFIPDWCAYFGLTLDSDCNEDLENGTPVLNKYGFIDIPKVKTYLKKKLDSIKNEHEKVAFIRKNPPTAEEALNFGGASNIFDTYRITERLKYLEDYKPTTERPVKYIKGNLAWKNNERFGEVVFNQDENNGKFKIAYLPNIAGSERTNKLFRQESIVRPFSDTPFRIGVDPFSYNNKKGDKFSLGGFHVKIMNNTYNPEFSNVYCLEYLYREMLSDSFYEDIILAMFFYGAKVNFERSAYSVPLERQLTKYKLNGFLMKRPDVTKRTKFTQADNELGTPASEENIALGIKYIQNYIAEPNPLINENTIDYLKNFWFEETLKQLLEYTVENKTQFDLVASMINTEIACQPDKKVTAAAKDHVKARNDLVLAAFRNPPLPKPTTRQLVTI